MSQRTTLFKTATVGFSPAPKHLFYVHIDDSPALGLFTQSVTPVFPKRTTLNIQFAGHTIQIPDEADTSGDLNISFYDFQTYWTWWLLVRAHAKSLHPVFFKNIVVTYLTSQAIAGWVADSGIISAVNAAIQATDVAKKFIPSTVDNDKLKTKIGDVANFLDDLTSTDAFSIRYTDCFLKTRDIGPTTGRDVEEPMIWNVTFAFNGILELVDNYWKTVRMRGLIEGFDFINSLLTDPFGYSRWGGYLNRNFRSGSFVR